VKYKPKTKMRVYQARALKKFIRNRGIIFLNMPMRSGKTKTAIDCACAARIVWGHPQRVLVVCPKSVIGVWVREIKKHSPLDYFISTRYGAMGTINEKSITWKIVNYEAMYTRRRVPTEDGYMVVMDDNQELYDFDPDMLIVDESTAMGDPTTVQSAKTFKLVRDLGIRLRILMTGTPWHRKLLYAFGSFKILNVDLFGTSWTAYKKTYGLWGGYAETKLLKYINLDQFRKKIAPWTYTLKHVPPMPPVHQVIPIPFTEGVQQYVDMASDAYTQIKNREVVGELVVTRLLRLAQLANGYARTADDSLVTVGRDKVTFAQDHLRSLKDQGLRKVVIVCEEKPQLLHAGRAAKQAGYGVIPFYGATENREAAIDKFQGSDKCMAMVMQISTGAMGIDLSAADTMIFWTPPTKFLLWDQVSARIRKYKDMRTLLYLYYIMEGTIEEAKYLALQQNIDLARLVGDHPELINFQEAG
jgi:superfamily II DNA or RNA helicase